MSIIMVQLRALWNVSDPTETTKSIRKSVEIVGKLYVPSLQVEGCEMSGAILSVASLWLLSAACAINAWAGFQPANLAAT